MFEQNEKTGVKPGYAKNKIPTNRIKQGFWENDLVLDSPRFFEYQAKIT